MALYLPYYTTLYRGGRNESFMYGYDDKTRWYDYDLTSAYTTLMCLLGDPNYDGVEVLSRTRLKRVSDDDLLKSYYYISGTFNFGDKVLFPSIPTDLPTAGTGPLLSIYPSSGECAITGPEYLLAVRKQKCEFNVSKAFRIPTTNYKPF